MHYYQFNIGDYAKSTKHLDPIEDLIYRRLLDLAYDTEKPLLKDVNKIARLIGMKTHLEETQAILDEFFKLTKNGYCQKRVQAEINKYHAKACSSRENGKKGGRPKKTQQVNLANPEETQPKAKQEPITTNHKPIKEPPKSKNKFSDADYQSAVFIDDKIKELTGSVKPVNLESWANEIRLMRERDNRAPREIGELFLWANNDPFWRSNILSPSKLRAQWDKLKLQRERPNETNKGFDTRSRSKRVADKLDEIIDKDIETNGFAYTVGRDDI